ncbi:MAG TPA: PilZ domain-containing protein [Blastocatellia bacterium]|nr:PilZ domain-containing protein [Blastocatellia bacterium]
MTDKEKRRASRAQLLLEVKYEGAGVRAETRISDISTTGVFVDAMTVLPVGSRIALSFKLPDGHTVKPEGVVRQSQPGIGMGIEFTKISPDDALHIQTFVHTH